MSDGFEVFYQAMVNTAKEFDQGSSAYKKLMPDTGPPAASGGNGAIDKTIVTTLNALGEMHNVLGQAMDSHSRKLEWAHDRYEGTETRIQQVLQNLITSSVPPVE
jgi:hypothetical protein